MCVRYQSITLEQPLENQQWRILKKKKKREYKFDEASQDTREVGLATRHYVLYVVSDVRSAVRLQF